MTATIAKTAPAPIRAIKPIGGPSSGSGAEGGGGGAAVGVGSVAAVGVGVAIGSGVAVAVGSGVGVAVGVAVGCGVGVGVGAVPTLMLESPPTACSALFASSRTPEKE